MGLLFSKINIGEVINTTIINFEEWDGNLKNLTNTNFKINIPRNLL